MSLYLDDAEHDGRFQTVVLYVVEDFNLSELMADFYRTYPDKAVLIKSETVLPELVEHLIAAQFVQRIDTQIVRLGTAGRPPKRMIDEYKYRLNPSNFLLDKLELLIHTRCNSVYGHWGKHFNLTSPQYCQYKVRAAIDLAGVHLGMIEIGVAPDANQPHPVKEDMQAFKRYIQDLIDAELPNEPLHVAQVFAPTLDEIEIKQILEKTCNHAN